MITCILSFSSTSYGGWVSDGVIAEIIDNSTVKCLSSHLTSFSVLVDIVADEIMNDNNDTNATETDTGIEEQILSVVSYIGCSVSIFCLAITIIWLLSFGYVNFCFSCKF